MSILKLQCIDAVLTISSDLAAKMSPVLAEHLKHNQDDAFHLDFEAMMVKCLILGWRGLYPYNVGTTRIGPGLSNYINHNDFNEVCEKILKYLQMEPFFVIIKRCNCDDGYFVNYNIRHLLKYSDLFAETAKFGKYLHVCRNIHFERFLTSVYDNPDPIYIKKTLNEFNKLRIEERKNCSNCSREEICADIINLLKL